MQVSVIIPVYNASAYLERCVSSCLAQVGLDFEVICVDDGSTDGSATILDKIARQNPSGPIKVFHQQNAGVVSARAKGISAAQGEWICFVDADDWLEPDALSVLTASADDFVDIVLGDHYLNSNDSCARRVPMPAFDVVSGVDYVDRCLKFGHGYIWGKIIRSDLCRDLGIQAGLCLNEDLLINVHTGLMARGVRYCSVPVYHYFWEGTSSLSKQVSAKSVASVMAVNQSIKGLLSGSAQARYVLDSGYVAYVFKNASQIYTLDFEVPEMQFVLREMRRVAVRHPIRFVLEALRRKRCALPFGALLFGLRFAHFCYRMVVSMRLSRK